MTSDEIRSCKNETPFGYSDPDAIFHVLREIAAQLAELNETLRSDRSLSVILHPSPDDIPVRLHSA